MTFGSGRELWNGRDLISASALTYWSDAKPLLRIEKAVRRLSPVA